MSRLRAFWRVVAGVVKGTGESLNATDATALDWVRRTGTGEFVYRGSPAAANLVACKGVRRHHPGHPDAVWRMR